MWQINSSCKNVRRVLFNFSLRLSLTLRLIWKFVAFSQYVSDQFLHHRLISIFHSLLTVHISNRLLLFERERRLCLLSFGGFPELETEGIFVFFFLLWAFIQVHIKLITSA